MNEPDAGWTLNTLHLHLTGQIRDLRTHTDQRFDDSDRVVKATLEASDKTVAAALSSQKEAAQKTEKSAADRHVELVQRLNSTADMLTEKITSLALSQERSQGGSHGMDRAWAFIIAVASIAIAIAAVVMK